MGLPSSILCGLFLKHAKPANFQFISANVSLFAARKAINLRHWIFIFTWITNWHIHDIKIARNGQRNRKKNYPHKYWMDNERIITQWWWHIKSSYEQGIGHRIGVFAARWNVVHYLKLYNFSRKTLLLLMAVRKCILPSALQLEISSFWEYKKKQLGISHSITKKAEMTLKTI